MGFLAVILAGLGGLYAVAALNKPLFVNINVLDYGAVGDGYTDDSRAFLRAWNVTCGFGFADTANMVIPAGLTFLVHPVSFDGPCRPKRIRFQLSGTIISPAAPSTWMGMDSTQWLAFRDVSKLIVEGNGLVHGRGTNWWSKSCRNNHGEGCIKKAPTAIKFLSCSNSHLRNLFFVDAANTHVLIKNSEWFYITNVRIRAPKTSPNTDGIHIEGSQHVYIDRSKISSGDDCISIGDRTSDIRITNIICGPGHGISVGSLGKGRSYVQVEKIYVGHIQFYQTTNGVRIKTWEGAAGYARDMLFEYLNFTAVQNPIIIDQYYCNNLYPDNCRDVEKSGGGVQVTGVTYKHAVGTSSTKAGITLNCSQSIACTEITLESIRLRSSIRGRRHQGESVTSSCRNARGRTRGVMEPNVPCLVQE